MTRKYMVKMLFLLSAFLAYRCATVSDRTETDLRNIDASMPNTRQIKVDNAAFEAGDKLFISDDLGNQLGYFQRIENPNNAVSGYALFDMKNTLQYKLMPIDDDSKMTILYKDKSGVRGSLEVAFKTDTRLGVIILSYETKMDFFQLPLRFETNSLGKWIRKPGSTGTDDIREEIFYFNENPFVAYVNKTGERYEGQQYPKIIANGDLVNQYPALVGAFALSLDLIHKLTAERQKRNPTIIHIQTPARR